MEKYVGRLGGQLGALLCLAGFLVIFFGWNGAASNNFVPAQFPYLVSGGIAGLALVVVGAALLVVQTQRADRARVEAVLERLVAATERHARGGAMDAGELHGFVLAGGSSYHRIGCELPEAHADARLVPLADIPESRLAACRVCHPPQFARLVDSA